MNQSQRKLVGTLALIVLVVAYPLAGMVLYVTYLAGSPWWGAILYAMVAGLGWALPAMAVIRWMARP